MLGFVILGIANLYSCVRDDIPAGIQPDLENSENYLQIHINLPELQSPDAGNSSTRAMNDVAERMIDLDSLNVLVFKNDAGTEKYAYKAPLSGAVKYDAEDGTKAIITVKLVKSQSGEQYRMVVIANHTIPSNALVAGTTTKADAMASLKYGASEKWNATAVTYRRFPLWGETDLVEVSASMSAQSVNLYRALARIDIGFNFKTVGGKLTEEADGYTDFKLKEVKVYRTYNKGYVAPLSSSMTNYTTPYIPGDAVRNADIAPISYSISGSGGADKYVREIYIPESNLPTSPANGNMHCIVIGGYYKGSSSITYYRLDFATETNPGGVRSYLPVLRNHRYVFNINTVRGPGFTSSEDALKSNATIENINYALISWDETITNLEVQGKYYFGVDQSPILFSPNANESSPAIFYQTNLENLATAVTFEWKKGAASPFEVNLHIAAQKKFAIATKTRNITNEILSDTLYIKAGPFKIPIHVEQKYVNFKYIIDCETVQLSGSYTNGTVLNPAQHIITLTLIAEDNTIIGENYSIETEDLEGNHGIGFSVSGTFNSLSQTVTLTGSGTLNASVADGPFKLRIKSNSSSGSYCEVTINPMDPTMNIVVIANNDNAYGYSIARLNGGAGKVFNSTNNFGPNDNSIVKTSGFNYIHNINFTTTNTTDIYKWVTGYNNNNKIADLVYIAYTGVLYDGTVNLLMEYLEKGGVVVAFFENYIRAREIANKLFNTSNITSQAATSYGVYPLPAHPDLFTDEQKRESVLRQFEYDPILNGPFGDIRDKQIGEDVGTTPALINFPISNPNTTIYAYNNNLVSATKVTNSTYVIGYKYESENKNLFFWSDGGLMSAGYSGVAPYNGILYTASTGQCPFYWNTTTYFPEMRPTYGSPNNLPVYNSIMFCNVMAWAIKKSQSLRSKREGNP